MVGTLFSINDYLEYFEKTFELIELKPNQPVEQMLPIEQHYEDEYTPEELERMENGESEDDSTSTDDDEGEWY